LIRGNQWPTSRHVATDPLVFNLRHLLVLSAATLVRQINFDNRIKYGHFAEIRQKIEASDSLIKRGRRKGSEKQMSFNSAAMSVVRMLDASADATDTQTCMKSER
jgi:hypothetical protein